MEMFDSLFNKIFVDSSKTGKWKYQPQNINKDHVSLLLAWPGMFLFNLVERLGNDDFSTKINELKELLCDSAKEDLDLDSNSEVKKLALELVQDFFSFLFLLTNPKSIHFKQGIIIRGIIKELTFFSVQYFIISCFFIDSAKKDKWTNKKYLSHNAILRIFKGNKPTDHFKYYQALLSWWWVYQLNEYLNHIPSLFREEDEPFSYLNSTELPLKGLYFNEVLNKQKNKIGIVSNGSVRKFKIPNKCKGVGVAVDIIKDEKIADDIFLSNYISLYAICFNYTNIGKKSVSYGFFFHKKMNIKACPTEELSNYLKFVSKKIIDLWDQIIGSLFEFIHSPEKFILPYLPNKEFRKYIENIVADKDSLKSMKNFPDYNRAFLSADGNFSWREEEFTQVRKIYVKALSKNTQISSSTKALLIEANQEIIRFFNKVRGKDALYADKLSKDDLGIAEYFRNHKSEYKYFEYIGENLILETNFFDSHKSNAIRNFSRKALPVIKNGIEGIPTAKPMSGKKLRQALGIMDP